MSDLSSNSMSREEMIRAARANCIKQIENRGDRGAQEERAQQAGSASPVKKGTLVRLFFAGILFLAFFAVKEYNLSFKQYNKADVRSVLESNKELDRLEKNTALLLEEKILPVFHRLN